MTSRSNKSSSAFLVQPQRPMTALRSSQRSWSFFISILACTKKFSQISLSNRFQGCKIKKNPRLVLSQGKKFALFNMHDMLILYFFLCFQSTIWTFALELLRKKKEHCVKCEINWYKTGATKVQLASTQQATKGHKATVITPLQTALQYKPPLFIFNG